MAALSEFAHGGSVAHGFGGTCYCSIGNGKLHVKGNSLSHFVARDVAIFHMHTVATRGVGSGFEQCGIGFVAVKARSLLHNGISHSNYPRVAYHTVGFIAPKVPNREASLLIGYAHHGRCEFS